MSECVGVTVCVYVERVCVCVRVRVRYVCMWRGSGWLGECVSGCERVCVCVE